jgi:hypothetical protein
MSEKRVLILRAAPHRIGCSRLAIHSRFALLAAAFGLLIGMGGFSANSALASSPIYTFTQTPSSTQAGGHPNIETDFTVGNHNNQNIPPPDCGCEDAFSVTTNLPTGVIGIPTQLPRCTQVEFSEDRCPVDSQIGVVELYLIINGHFGLTPVYNLVPRPNQVGLAAFIAPFINSPVYIVISSRTNSDYGLTSEITGIEHIAALEGAELTLWGVPADPSHDPQRMPVEYDPFYSQSPSGAKPPTQSNSPLVPFIDNPTTCGTPLSASIEDLSYDGGTSQLEDPYPMTTGCDQLAFNPSLFAQPTTQETDSPSGVALELSVPQNDSPTVPSASEIREVAVKFPPGFTLDANAADGKTSCTDAEAHFGTLEAAQCPEFSKIGTVEIESPALPGPLPGYIYIGQPQPGNRYRLFLVADGFGLHVKLPGSALPDPATGQLTVNFAELPQFPFSAFLMHFFGAERGLMGTPDQCGTYPVNTTFTPWDSALPKQTSTQYFVLNSGPGGTPCPSATRPFAPALSAASTANAAGAHAPLWFDLTRSDGDQNLSAVNVSTPPGLSATLAGIPYCSNAAIAAAADPNRSGAQELASPSCPPASQIGTATAGEGAGTHPVYFPGKVYLAGPYKGAPLSLVVITPAITGPYDLGSVVIRAALKVDPTTAQVTAVSDPLPQILKGIPLRYRSIFINLNRPNFILNPTNCDPLAVDAEVFGDQGGLATPHEHFQVTNCSTLAFAPKLALKLSGPTKRTGNPALSATLTAKPGEANVSHTVGDMPTTEILDNAHLKNPCTRLVFAEGLTPGQRCPAGSVIGYAKAETPLLAKPLEGPVYLRSAPENKSGLPDVVAALNGQIDITLDGKISTVHGGLRTTFGTVPDAPVSKFTLSLDGGAKGLLENSTNLCAASEHVSVQMAGQNGLTANQDAVLRTPCGKPGRHRHRARKEDGG